MAEIQTKYKVCWVDDDITEPEIVDWIVRCYEFDRLHAGNNEWHRKHDFGDWLRYQFDHWAGGSIGDTALEKKGAWFYDYMGSELWIRYRRFGQPFTVRIEKARLFKIFGIKTKKG